EKRLRGRAFAGGHDGGGEGVEVFRIDGAEDGGEGEFFAGIFDGELAEGAAGVGGVPLAEAACELKANLWIGIVGKLGGGGGEVRRFVELGFGNSDSVTTDAGVSVGESGEEDGGIGRNKTIECAEGEETGEG